LRCNVVDPAANQFVNLIAYWNHRGNPAGLSAAGEDIAGIYRPASAFHLKQATRAPPLASSSAGATLVLSSIAAGHLVLNLHPFGGLSGLGISLSRR
jgi:hypothetical protein